MRTRFVFGLLVPAIAGLMLLAVETSMAQDGRIGVSAAVTGQVEVRSGSTGSRAPLGGESMFLGDRVLTASRSGMQVLLLDESVFTVGESNDLVIDRFVYDPDRSVGEIAARSTQGFLRFVSGGVGAIAPQSLTLETPSATIGTRGTSVDVVVGPAAVELARSLGLIGPGDVVDPRTAVFVILRGPSVSYGGITQRGRVRVETPAGSVEIRREGYGVFVPFAGAPPSDPVPIPSDIDQAVIESIELPDQGAASNVGTVNITQLPSIDASPRSIVGPGGGPGNPDVTGPGFEDRIPQLTAVDPCILNPYATICGD